MRPLRANNVRYIYYYYLSITICRHSFIVSAVYVYTYLPIIYILDCYARSIVVWVHKYLTK